MQQAMSGDSLHIVLIYFKHIFLIWIRVTYKDSSFKWSKNAFTFAYSCQKSHFITLAGAFCSHHMKHTWL